MEYRAYMMVYENGKKKWNFSPLCPKHHEIQEFAKNCHISASSDLYIALTGLSSGGSFI
jgi:hypothetical protein